MMQASLLLIFCRFINTQALYNGFNIAPYNSTVLAMPDTLDSLKIMALLGSNWIGVNYFLRQSNATSDDIHFEERTPTKDVWTTFIQEAHKYNLGVLLKPMVVCGNECSFAIIVPGNITSWFSRYEEIILNISMMAQELGADALSVGLEFAQISNTNYTSNWKNVIRKIRTGGYTGLLTYCSIFYPIETQNIGFWDELDFIGMDFYLPLLNITQNGSIPSQQDMTTTLSHYFQFFKTWFNEQPPNVTSKSIVFTEIGYPSSLSGMALPSGIPADECVGNYTTNFTLQDMAYKALVQALDDNKGLFSGLIIFWWDNPSSPDFYKNRDSNNWGCSWTVQGKPAECTIAKGFGRVCPMSQTNSFYTHSVLLMNLKLFFGFLFLFLI